MATGEKKWNSGDQQVKRTSFSPIPTGDYTLKVKRSWETRKSESEKSSQLRYANGYFEVIIPGKDKPRRQYHSFHCDLTPSESDGVAMPNRGGQIAEFCKATGENLSSGIIQQKKRLKNGEYKTVDTLSPKAIAEFMNNLDGTTLKAHIKVEKNWKNEDDNVIEYFIESDDESGNDDDGDSDESEELDEAEESEEVDEEDEVEELEDGELDEDADESDEADEEPEEEEEVDDLPPRDTGKGKVKQGPPAKGGKKPVAKKKGKK